MYTKLFYKFIGFVFVSVFLISPAIAADFYFDNLPKTIPINQEFRLDITVDAKDKTLNAVSGKVIIPDEYFTIKQILTGESGISFWVDSPAISAKDKILFSGIVTNGFTGKIKLFSVITSPNKIGNASIKTDELTTLLNDGKGTADTVSALEAQISITAASTNPVVIESPDFTPPEFDAIELVKNTSLCRDNYALIFHAADKQTGVDEYRILEQKKYSLFGLNFKTGVWKKTESPSCLSDQKLQSDIFIKVTDMAGNSKIVGVAHSSPIPWYENILLWGIIILLALLSIALFLIYAYRGDKK
jgi:hypothetical protein